MRTHGKLFVAALVLVFSVSTMVVHAARLMIFTDGVERAIDAPTRGKAGRAAWEAAVKAARPNATILTNDFNGVNIDVPADTVTSVGHFSVYFSQKGGYSKMAGNTAPRPHPTGVFVGTTGTGSVQGGNDEIIDGLELRFETGQNGGPVTTALELRFDPPIYAWGADVYSLDGPGFGGGADKNDHTTMHLLGRAFDLSRMLEYAGSGYNSFFGILSDVPFDVISWTATNDGDRWRLDNISIAR